MPSFIQRSLQSDGVTWSPYHWWTISWTSTALAGGVGSRSQRDHRLGLHPAQRVDQEDAQRRPGVGAELVLDPVERLGGEAQLVEVLPRRRRDPVADRDAARGLVLGDLVVAEGDGDEVRRRLAVEHPSGDRVAVLHLVGGHHAVGDAGHRGGCREDEVVEGLVGRLVVDGVPGVGAVRLLHRPCRPVVGDGEARRAEVPTRRGRLHGHGRAGVVQRQRVLLVLHEVAGDDEVLAGVLEVGRLAVDLQGRHLELLGEVELHVVCRAGGSEPQGLRPGEDAAVGIPGELEAVGESVDRRVSDVGVDAVLDGLAEPGVAVVGLARRRRVGTGPRRRRRRVGRGRRGLVVAAGGEAGEQRGRRQRCCQWGAGHSDPLSIGRTSLRPWWICALTVPSGAPTCWAISS